MKGERMAKRSSIGSMVRKRLSDITNSQSQPRLPALQEKQQQQQQQQQPQIPESSEDLVNQLLKEKATLLKLIEERNKIIELSGNELRNLRMNYQKLQMQNWNLAQSNSQMLAELNLGRDKVKALQHELVCKDALLKAKYLEKEGKMDMNCQATGRQEGKEASEECLNKEGSHMRPCNRSRRRTARSQSMGPSTTNRQTTDKEKVENKRRCLRRQSARFRSQDRESADNLFEIEVVKFPASAASQPMQENEDGRPTSTVPHSSSSSSSSSSLPQHRSSIGRPLRRAVQKVQSYKEQPVNVKMRRAE